MLRADLKTDTFALNITYATPKYYGSCIFEQFKPTLQPTKTVLKTIKAFQPFNGHSKVQVEDNIYITTHKDDPTKDSEFSGLILI